MITGKLAGLLGVVMALAPWTSAHASCTLSKFFPSGGLPSFPAFAAGPDGNVWFAGGLLHQSSISRITPDGVITEFGLPADMLPPSAITAGPDGHVWFTSSRFSGLGTVGKSQIGRVGLDGALTRFDLPGAEPFGIAAGPDGNLWVTLRSGLIARVTPTGAVTSFPLPWARTWPRHIAAGPDGALWFTDQRLRIGRITPGGGITEFPLPFPEAYFPDGIAAGPDGNVWFTTRLGRIGRITPAGALTLFRVPIATTQPRQITSGPDGNLWFTAQIDTGLGEPFGKIGRITPAGVISEFDVGLVGSLGSIVTGADRRLWFGDGRIFRLALPPFADVPVDHWAVDPTVALLRNGVSAGCGVNPAVFCPETPVTRGQLAALLLRAETPGVVPPPCVVAPFADVPCTSPFAAWIAALAARGLTAGCGPNLYCPERPLSRAEVAVLLVRLVAGPDFVPGPCAQRTFGDVPCSSPFAPWIQELARREIAAGCGRWKELYCPDEAATRAEIAVLLTRAFSLRAC